MSRALRPCSFRATAHWRQRRSELRAVCFFHPLSFSSASFAAPLYFNLYTQSSFLSFEAARPPGSGGDFFRRDHFAVEIAGARAYNQKPLIPSPREQWLNELIAIRQETSCSVFLPANKNRPAWRAPVAAPSRLYEFPEAHPVFFRAQTREIKDVDRTPLYCGCPRR